MFGIVTDFVVLENFEQLAPHLQRLLEYWKSKTLGRKLPARRDIDPVEIPKIMPHLAILDILRDPFDYRYRLTGTKFVEAIGHDRTGMRAREIFKGPALEQTVALIARLAERGVPLAFEGNMHWIDKSYRHFQALCLPLASDGETVDMAIMGLHIADDDSG